MSLPISSHTKLPFYICTDKDRQIYELIEAGIINWNGSITDAVKEKLDRNLCKLETQVIKSIQKFLNNTFSISGRCKTSIDVETSIFEIAKSVESVVKDKFSKNPKLLLVGGRIWSLLKISILRIFTSVYPSKDNSSLTNFNFPRLQKAPSDTDWQFQLGLEKISDSLSVIDQGFVKPLAVKLKQKNLNPYSLTLQLENSKRKAAEKSDSYLGELFEKNPLPNGVDDGVYDYTIKAYGFRRAKDIQKPNATFSLRSIGNEGNIHDCVFPFQSSPSSTHMTALCVDVTSILHNEKNPVIYLESLIGPSQANVIQAIVDGLFSNFTFEESVVADRLDFARTISHFMQGGSCIQEGWLDKTMSALLKEQQNQSLELNRNVPLSEILSSQLISRTTHHHNGDHNALIVLTFIASSILYQMDKENLGEIQQLWQYTFAFVNKAESKIYSQKPDITDKNEGRSQLKSYPLIEQIKILMRNPEFSFLDLYAMIQVTSSLMQHGQMKGEGDYYCKPTQTGRDLYIQLVLNPPKDSLKKCSNLREQDLSIFALFFPYDLPNAIQHLSHVADASPMTFHYLRRIGEILIPGNAISFCVERSPLQVYSSDPRLKLDLCRKNIYFFLNQKNAQAWMTGFLLALTIQSQKHEEHFSNELLYKMIDMFLEEWPEESFKKEVLSLYQKANSLNVECLKSFKTTDLVLWLFSSGRDMNINLAIKYLDRVDAEEDYSVNISLFANLLKICLENSDKTLFRSALHQLIKRMDLPHIIQPETSLKLIRALYEKKGVSNDQELESILFNVLVNTLQRLKSADEMVCPFMLKVIQMESRLKSPLQGLRFAREIHRLKLIPGKGMEMYTEFKTALDNIQRCLSNLNNLDLSLLTEEFDISSPFASQYCSQNLPLLKNSISLALQELQKSSSSTNSREVVFIFLRRLIHMETIWDERHYFIRTIEFIIENSPIADVESDIEALLELFHTQNLCVPSCELLEFYLEKKTPFLRALQINLVINLIVHSEDDFSDIQLQTVTANLHQMASQSIARQRIQKLPLYFFQKLLKRGLCEEIVMIYVLCPHYCHSNAIQSTSLIIQTALNLLQSSRKKISKELFENIEQLIDKIPMSAIVDDDVRDGLLSLCQYYFNAYHKEMDLTNGMRWLEKERLLTEVLSNDFYERAFGLIAQLLVKGHVREAGAWISKLDVPQGFETSWLNIYKILLRGGNVATCLNLIENNKALESIDKEVFRKEWLDILNEIHSRMIEIAKGYKKVDKIQLDNLFAISNKLAFECNPSFVFWLKYIELAIDFAPLIIIEKIFSSMAQQQDYSIPLNQQVKKLYLFKILDRLSKEGSAVFFLTEKWWPFVWQEYKDEKDHIKLDLIYKLIKGASTAIDIYSAHGSAKLGKDKLINSQSIARGALEIISFIESPELLPFQNNITFDNDSFYLSSIYMATNTHENKIKAILNLTNFFLYREYDPIIEQKLVLQSNEFLRKMKDVIEMRTVFASLNAIYYIQGCEYHYDVDHFVVLEYLHSITELREKKKKENPNYKKSKNLCDDPNEPVFIELRMVKQAIHGILDTRWQTTKKIGTYERNLMCWGLKRLCDSSTFRGWETICWSLDQKDLLHYADDGVVKKMKKFKESFNPHYMTKINYQLRQGYMDMQYEVGMLIDRASFLRTNGMLRKFRVLKDENYIITAYIITVFIGAVAIGIIHNMWSQK